MTELRGFLRVPRSFTGHPGAFTVGPETPSASRAFHYWPDEFHLQAGDLHWAAGKFHGQHGGLYRRAGSVSDRNGYIGEPGA